MMRKIKFRAKGKSSGNWYYGYYIVFNGQSFIQEKNGNMIAVLSETVGQFTSSKDKNGKEIYEDDIINYQYNYQNYMSLVKYEGASFYAGYNLLEQTEIVEIIGNKYENPELLGDVNECSR